MGIRNKFVAAKEGLKMATKIWQKNKDAILYKHRDKILHNYKGLNQGKVVGDLVGERSATSLIIVVDGANQELFKL